MSLNSKFFRFLLVITSLLVLLLIIYMTAKISFIFRPLSMIFNILILLGVLLYIGFMIIGLPYALLLAVIATVLNIIPYIGQFLGAIPCLIVAFIDAPSMIIWVLIVTVIAQQIESSFLSPHIYGKRLDIHPLTTIILLLVAGDIVGILGVILAIPAYMVVKIIVVRIYRIFLAEKFEELIE
jgi:predicted PurR-regulated permease PerM